jgi:hypothetical protein
MKKFLLQCRACCSYLGEKPFILRQQVINIAWVAVGVVGILQVKVEVVRLDFVERNTPSLLIFDAGGISILSRTPPCFSDSNSSMRIGFPLL